MIFLFCLTKLRSEMVTINTESLPEFNIIPHPWQMI